MTYRLILDQRAERELAALPDDILRRIDSALQRLTTAPRPRGCKKLQGTHRPGWRIRVGDYRILYHILDSEREVIVFKIGHRKEVYE